MIPLINVQDRQIYRGRKSVSGFRGMGADGGLRDDGSLYRVLTKLHGSDGCTAL